MIFFRRASSATTSLVIAAAAAACLGSLPGAAVAFGSGARTAPVPRRTASSPASPADSSTARSGGGSWTSSASSSSSSKTALLATWSNGQAIKEYQDFLATGQSELIWADDGPSVIVASASHVDGTKRYPVADALMTLGNGDDMFVRPGDPLPPTMGGKEEYPIYVALPPYELDAFLSSLSTFEGYESRNDDFVFLSGGEVCGCIEDVLKKFGYARDTTTQVLLGGITLPDAPYQPQDISVNLGLDAQGEAKYSGECAACGKWAGAFAGRLELGGAIRCRVGFYREWRRWMWEKAMYDAAFNLAGAVRQDQETTLKDAAEYYEEEVSDMMWQMSATLRGRLAVTVTYGFEERLFGFAEMRGREIECGLPDATMYPYVFPTVIAEATDVAQYLNYAQSQGQLQGCALPSSAGSDQPSKMLQGNLRCDGVV